MGVRIISYWILGLILMWIMLCCRPHNSRDMAESNFPWEGFKNDTGYDLSAPSEKYLLPDILHEVSGLSYLKNQVLACIQDEQGTIFLFDLKEKKVTDRFNFAKNGDFEGIEVVGDDIYTIKSNGKLFKYHMPDGLTSEIETPLSNANDVEGLAFDPQFQRLLIACKESAGLPGNKIKGKAVYSYYLSGTFTRAPTYLLKGDQLDTWNQSQQQPINLTKRMKAFKPSGIAVHPKSHDIYIIAYIGRVLLVLTAEGHIKNLVPLPAKLFPQPEGICFAPNGDLFISNESSGNAANILQFKPITIKRGP